MTRSLERRSGDAEGNTHNDFDIYRIAIARSGAEAPFFEGGTSVFIQHGIKTFKDAYVTYRAVTVNYAI